MQIDKNIPIPKRGKSTADKYKHHKVIFESWEIGDSVTFLAQQKTTGKDRRRNYSKEAVSFVTKAKRYGQKVVTRIIAKDSVVRVWRVE